MIVWKREQKKKRKKKRGEIETGFNSRTYVKSDFSGTSYRLSFKRQSFYSVCICRCTCPIATCWLWGMAALFSMKNLIEIRIYRRFLRPVQETGPVPCILTTPNAILVSNKGETALAKFTTPHVTGQRCARLANTSLVFTERRLCHAKSPLLEIWRAFISKLHCDKFIVLTLSPSLSVYCVWCVFNQ